MALDVRKVGRRLECGVVPVQVLQPAVDLGVVMADWDVSMSCSSGSRLTRAQVALEVTNIDGIEPDNGSVETVESQQCSDPLLTTHRISASVS